MLTARQQEHAVYLASWEWFWIRKHALHRANYQCERCGGFGNLDVHHLTYEHWKAELPEDLQVLCTPCHAEHHGFVPERHSIRPVRAILPAIFARIDAMHRGTLLTAER